MTEALRKEVGAATTPGASLRLVVPPNARYAKYVRDRVATFTQVHAIPESDANDFMTAVGEALANAIEHGRTDRKIEVSCWLLGASGLMATVVDGGVGFAAHDALREPRQAHVDAERGRGLAIMRRCTDQVAVHSTPGQGTAVILTRYVRHRHLHAVGGPPSGG